MKTGDMTGRKKGMNRRIFVFFCIGLVVASAICGCISNKPVLPEYRPVEKREGRVFCYTRDFFEGPGCQVCFFRQPYEYFLAGDGGGPLGITPRNIILGVGVCVPLALADWLIASPVVDVVLLPYDIKCKLQPKGSAEQPQSGQL